MCHFSSQFNCCPFPSDGPPIHLSHSCCLISRAGWHAPTCRPLSCSHIPPPPPKPFTLDSGTMYHCVNLVRRIDTILYLSGDPLLLTILFFSRLSIGPYRNIMLPLGATNMRQMWTVQVTSIFNIVRDNLSFGRLKPPSSIFIDRKISALVLSGPAWPVCNWIILDARIICTRTKK